MIEWFLILTAVILSPSVAEVFYVTPTLPPNQPCSKVPCHTLDQYAQNQLLIEDHNASNVTLIFLRGEHTLRRNLSFSGINRELSLSLQGQITSSNDVNNTSRVIIQMNVQMYFTNLIDLRICDLTIVSNHSNQPYQYYQYYDAVVSDTITNIGNASENIVLINLELHRMTLTVEQAQSVHVSDCTSFWSIFKFIDTTNISVINYTLYSNESLVGIFLLSRIQNNTSLFTHLNVHNSYFIFYGYSRYLITIGICSTIGQVRVLISNTRFEGSQYGLIILNSPAVGLTALDDHFYLLQFLKTLLFELFPSDNIWNADKSQNNVFGVSSSQGKIQITNTLVQGCTYGIVISHVEILILNTSIMESRTFGLVLKNTSNINISNSNITSNFVGIVNVGSSLTIQNTSIYDNTFGFVITAPDILGPIRPGTNTSTSIQNCKFSFNNPLGIVLINSHGKLKLRDCVFNENKGTPIIAYQSTFELTGETVFRDNTADRGGGLALYNSTVTFGPGSNTQFINNTAREYGGAIYVVSLTSFLSAFIIKLDISWDVVLQQLREGNRLFQYNCFYSASKVDESVTQVIFARNKAGLGGLDIFGPTLYTNNCAVQINSRLFVFNHSELASESTSQISSNPSRVCFCNNDTPQCKNKNFLVLNETRYPGESFSVPVVITGYNFGRVAGSVYTNVIGQDYGRVIDKTQHIQAVSYMMRDTCGNLNLTIKSYNQTRNFLVTLTVQEQLMPEKTMIDKSYRNIRSRMCKALWPPCTALLTTNIYVNITLKPCPLGLMLNDDGVCDCDQQLVDNFNDGNALSCKIQDQAGYITREGTVWVGTSNNTELYYWHKYCPTDYCNSSRIDVDLKYPDVQCESYRTGIMCGSCQDGYSLQLGSNNCARCGNERITLLIIFALLGILLVVLITTLDLTVASGTINGLIFYANVVWRNIEMLLLISSQNRNTTEEYYRIITVPIAWINLDFGIETCFSESLDQLSKTGLQFVFPVYIWCIAGLIIIISHYSTRATKLFGNNSVAVLATLFLLSYGKLFRSITDVLTYADIDSNGGAHTVWMLDGNVKYNRPEHIVLIVVALVFLIFFVLPFTLMLLLVPLLRVKSDLRPLHWVNRLKPFFDTYYGPFKHKKRYQVWTGILLLSRVILFAIFASTSTISPDLTTLFLIVIAVILLVYTALVGLLYKNWFMSLLEILYLLNLIILGGIILFHPQSSFKLAPILTISLCAALFQFSCTLIFHIVRRIFLIEKVKVCLMEKLELVSITLKEKNPRPMDTGTSGFRESLLMDSM